MLSINFVEFVKRIFPERGASLGSTRNAHSRSGTPGRIVETIRGCPWMFFVMCFLRIAPVHGMVWYDMVWYGMAPVHVMCFLRIATVHGAVWYGMVWILCTVRPQARTGSRPRSRHRTSNQNSATTWSRRYAPHHIPSRFRAPSWESHTTFHTCDPNLFPTLSPKS